MVLVLIGAIFFPMSISGGMTTERAKRNKKKLPRRLKNEKVSFKMNQIEINRKKQGKWIFLRSKHENSIEEKTSESHKIEAKYDCDSFKNKMMKL